MEMIYIAIEKSIEGRFNRFVYDVVLNFLHYAFFLTSDGVSEVERITLLGLLNIKRLKKSFRYKNLEDVSRIIVDTIYGYFGEGGGELNDEEREPQVKEYLREKLQYYLTKYK